MLSSFESKGMEMEQIWMEQPWLVAGGAGAVLLIIVVWLFLRRRSQHDEDTESTSNTRAPLTEPTLEPTPTASEATDTDARPGDTAEAQTDDVEPGVTEGPSEDGITETPDSEAQVIEIPVTAGEPEVAQGTAPGDAAEKSDLLDADLPAPEPPPVNDPDFVAAREAFEHELLAGNFSRLDVFAAYERAREDAGSPNVPRSEFFHHVVNRALEIRDAFEALLRDEDRRLFVDMHSRYLDAVTEEADSGNRERLHREHQEKLDHLRP
jgi:hypothetical protein